MDRTANGCINHIAISCQSFWKLCGNMTRRNHVRHDVLQMQYQGKSKHFFVRSLKMKLICIKVIVLYGSMNQIISSALVNRLETGVPAYQSLFQFWWNKFYAMRTNFNTKIYEMLSFFTQITVLCCVRFWNHCL